MDNFVHDFIEGCKREGIKDPSRLKYTPKHYLAVFVEMTSNGKNPIRVKEYHRAVGGGEYKVAKVAFNLLNQVNDVQDRIAAPRPQWFQQFVASTAGFVQDLWEEISMEIQREVEERVQVSEAARNMAEKEQASTEDYLEEIIAEKHELEITVEEFAGYRERNEELHHELKDLARDKYHIEEKLSDVVEEVNALRLQIPELQSLRIHVAKIEAELEIKTQQVSDYREMLRFSESFKLVSDNTETLSKHALQAEECDS
ncbi:hypothetical protein HYO33_21585 [Vibrio parahaemolyticus]|uniref:hypothetical protein n=1 Tax=Vibrio TaxID=662 RepID=UPI0002FF01DB|nr:MULTISPECIES: hypothetical protein [Vibrio]ASM96270.1 hypothetical protein AOT11_13740 [Vibrio vulnificus NBRC 15645 = ATCC 27562]EGQ7876746.1 hypothetical protein [Vibrio parahaemolyticus]EGR1363400.1 hypothetical protein [Vibrio parahaemolyticus]EGR9059648.1 hypothetical protein [Vibrio parahaemolyticus]EHW8641048.1 hypothetical protein [Vibrio parahaemolyticus]